MYPDSQHGELGRVRGGDTDWKKVFVSTEEGRGGPHGIVLVLLGHSWGVELPTFGLADDAGFVFVGRKSSGGEDPAVVGAAGPRAMLIDGTTMVAQHRTAALFIVAEENVALG